MRKCTLEIIERLPSIEYNRTFSVEQNYFIADYDIVMVNAKRKRVSSPVRRSVYNSITISSI